MRLIVYGLVAVLFCALATAASSAPTSVSDQAMLDCAHPQPGYLMCEDFENGSLGWNAWFAQSPWVECLGCNASGNIPGQIQLVDNESHDGQWSLYMPAAASAGYQGASLTWRDCNGTKQQGCNLLNHDELYFRTWVKLAPDHQHVHHFLSIGGTTPDGYWNSEGTAGCRPTGNLSVGTTLDMDSAGSLFWYTYFPAMHCDPGEVQYDPNWYCSGSYVQNICTQCASRGLACTNGPECCWGNVFHPSPAVTLPEGPWECLELHLKLNTPGKNDSVMQFWLNGQLMDTHTGIAFRDTSDVGLNKAWLQHYIPAGEVTYSNRIWFDDVAVSTQYISCGPAPNTTGTTPPVVSAGSPSGPLPSGTTNATLSVQTNENATCRYSVSSGTPYASMTDAFSTTDGIHHTAALTGLQDGASYSYNVRCNDSSGNVDPTDYPVSFSVSAPSSSLVVSVDSTYAGYSSAVIHDSVINATGGTATTWASAESTTSPHWIEFTFPAPTVLHAFTIDWAYNSRLSSYMTSQHIVVQYWNGTAFSNVTTVLYSGDVARSNVTFPPANATIFRLYQPADQGSSGYPSVMWLTEVGYNTAASPGDLTGDGKVDLQDLVLEVENLHKTSGYTAGADLNGDGTVNIFDLVLLVQHWSTP